MAEEIKVGTKSKLPKIVDVTRQKRVPELSLFMVTQFKQQSIIVLEDRLLELGIIVPHETIEELLPALIEVGKIYYDLTVPRPF